MYLDNLSNIDSLQQYIYMRWSELLHELRIDKK